MPFGEVERRREGLRVFWMALALVLAAFLGAALGLVWQSSGLGKSDEEKAAEAKEQGQGADTEAAEAKDKPTPPTSG